MCFVLVSGGGCSLQTRGLACWSVCAVGVGEDSKEGFIPQRRQDSGAIGSLLGGVHRLLCWRLQKLCFKNCSRWHAGWIDHSWGTGSSTSWICRSFGLWAKPQNKKKNNSVKNMFHLPLNSLFGTILSSRVTIQLEMNSVRNVFFLFQKHKC